MSSSDLFDVQLRPMVDTDRPYVIATWLHSYWQAVQHQQRKADFFMVQHELIERLLQAGRTQIACMGASPSTIVGWACASAKAVIHYVYVREEHRLNGYARDLMEAVAHGDVIYCTHSTPVFDAIRHRHDKLHYVPQLLAVGAI